MAITGYAFVTQFQTLLGYFEKANWAISIGIFIAGYLFWRRYKANYAQESQHSADREQN